MFNAPKDEILREVKFFDLDLHNTFIKNSSKIRYAKKEAVKREQDIATLESVLQEMRCPEIEIEIDSQTKLIYLSGSIFLCDQQDNFCYNQYKSKLNLLSLDSKYLAMLFEKAIEVLGQ